MILFYTTNIEGDYAYLNNSESKHCIQVLRKQEGDKVYFIDGEGGFYEAEIVDANRKKCVLQILKKKIITKKGITDLYWQLHQRKVLTVLNLYWKKERKLE